MKVKDLIKELKKFNPEMEVGYYYIPNLSDKAEWETVTELGMSLLYEKVEILTEGETK